MKTLLAVVLFILIASMAFAQTYVNPYTRKDGTEVRGHYRSERNDTPTDNYNFKGNTNPYTGERGQDKATDNPNSPYYTPFK